MICICMALQWCSFFGLRLFIVIIQFIVTCQDGNDKLEGVDIEEVCADRPADEYFRLDTEGDCREVYR